MPPAVLTPAVEYPARTNCEPVQAIDDICPPVNVSAVQVIPSVEVRTEPAVVAPALE